MKVSTIQPPLPEGNWRGALLYAKKPKVRLRKSCEEQIQLTFAIDHNGYPYRVYRKFCADASPGTELWYFLQSWLQNDFERYIDDDGQIDFDGLIREEADMSVVHYSDGQHPSPIHNIIAILPPGTLVEE